MITNNFKDLLKNLSISGDDIDIIDRYLTKERARINADMIEYPDGSNFYSEEYLKIMMQREHARGREEGIRQPVIHTAEMVIMPCTNCGHTEVGNT